MSQNDEIEGLRELITRIALAAERGSQTELNAVLSDFTVMMFPELQEYVGSQLRKRTIGGPTEAEWEYASRAGTTTAYYWGNDADGIGTYAWYSGNSGSMTHPVGQKLPNAWGLYDTSGNVCEWCSDWYDGKLSGGTDPRGASSGSFRVYRGGSWLYSAWSCRSANRGWFTPSNRYSNLGFRVATVSGTGLSSE